MAEYGIYCAYWKHNWGDDFMDCIPKAAQLGFDLLEVNAGMVTNMSRAERDSLKRASDDAGIGITFCFGLTNEYDIASEDASVRRRGIEFLRQQAETMRDVNARKLGGIIYGAWPASLPDGVTDKRPFFDRSVAAMKEVMKPVEDYDLLFNVEVVNRFEQFMLNCCKEAVEYVTQVGSEHCKILLDTFHMNIEEDTFYDALVCAGDMLGHFHVGENNRRAPGHGHIPWQEIACGLKQIGYQGSVVMEPFVKAGGEIGRDIAVYRDLTAGLDLDAEAKRALGFIREVFDGKESER